jgi:hypothetical protein
MKKSKSLKVAEYFLANPDATPKVVGTKFKVAMPSVYAIRKRVLSGSMLDKVSPQITDAVTQKARDVQEGGTHYKEMGVQPWDVVDTWSREQQIGYYRGGALKYIMRMGTKDQSAREIAKGKHYMQKLLEVLGD